MADRDRTGQTIALVGGAALTAWWLLSRGNGWGFRSPGDGKGQGQNADPTRSPGQCKVWIYPERLTVDGVAADLPTVVEACRAVGTAQVGATGDAITGVIHGVLRALQAAGIKLLLPPSLEWLARLERL